MDAIISFFQYIQSLGVSVMMPIIICILALCFRVKLGDAIRAGLTVGVAFIGLNLVIGIFGNNLGPTVQHIAELYGLELSVIDVGWPGVSAIAYASAAGALVIPLCLLTNAVMLMLKLTQTMDVDLWNFWHYALVAAFVEILTGNIVLSLIVAMLNFAIVLVIADNFVDGLEETNGLPGISIPNAFAAAFAPVALVINKVIDLIPGVRDIDIDFTKLQEKAGVFGEPIFIGTVLGTLLGIVAQEDFASICTLAITMGAVLVLIPKMAALLMDGLLPISNAASDFMQEHFAGRGKIYIGLDSAVAIGHPVTLSVSLILVPIVVFLAVIIPGNKMVPFVDLAVIPYMFALITPMVRGNGFRCSGNWCPRPGCWPAFLDRSRRPHHHHGGKRQHRPARRGHPDFQHLRRFLAAAVAVRQAYGARYPRHRRYLRWHHRPVRLEPHAHCQGGHRGIRRGVRGRRALVAQTLD